MQPVLVLVGIDEELQKHHGQEGPTKGGDLVVCRQQQTGVLGFVEEGEIDDLQGPHVGHHADDCEREHDAHAEHCNQDSPQQEAFAPLLVHVLEHRGIDHGVVERQ